MQIHERVGETYLIGKPKGLGMESRNGSWARKTLHLSVSSKINVDATTDDCIREIDLSSLETSSVNHCIIDVTSLWLYSYCRQTQRQVRETEPTNGNLMIQVNTPPRPSLDHSAESAPAFHSFSSCCPVQPELTYEPLLTMFVFAAVKVYTLPAFKPSYIVQDVHAQRVWTQCMSHNIIW